MTFQLSSIGKSSCSLICLTIAGVALAACGPTMPQLRAQAAKDFDCPKEGVKIATVDSDTMYASCYEQEATYTSTCEGEEGCRWVQDEKLDKDASKANY